MLILKKLTKKFSSITAVNNLSLEIPKGEVFILVGPNGAGKTTTIKMICGIYKPNAGEVLIDNIDVQKEPEKAKTKIGYIPDDPFIYDKLSGRDFLYFVGSLFLMSKNQIAQQIKKYLEVYPITDLLDIPFASLSRGSKQKFSIIAALIHNPNLLVIDEPIVGLDPESANATKDLFLDFKSNGGTIFLSTHTLSFAEKIADIIGILHKGKLIETGTITQLRKKAHSQKASLEDLFLKII